MRGAPQVGFSATIRKIKARTSLLTRFRRPTWLILETHVQYKRNPARCQFTTVLGVTKTRGCLHPDQHILNATQNSLCRAVNRRRGRCACSASNCRRRAKFSRTRSARQLKELTNQPRKCRSDKIMAKNFSGKDRIELRAKSLISLVYDLLARHNQRNDLIEKTLSIPDAYEVFLKVGADPEVQKLRRKVARGNKMKHVPALYLATAMALQGMTKQELEALKLRIEEKRV